MDNRAFLIDVDKCSGCKLCVVVCKDEHVGSDHLPWTTAQPDTGHFWVDVRSMERGRLPRIRLAYLPLFCQHCSNAPCIKICPGQAIDRRDDGLVWIDPAACNGCGLCQKACPFNVIYMNQELHIAQKCTGCAHRVDDGLLPRCAEVCPHEAIVFGEAGPDERTEVYHPEYHTQPRVLWKGLPKPWIAGTVVDAIADEVVPGAAITSLDLFDDGSVTVTSDDFGDFWIKGLQEGRKYKVGIKKHGYKDFIAVVTTDGDQDLGDVCLTRVP